MTNNWVKFYGFIGLVSTIGKNTFTNWQQTSQQAQEFCQHGEKFCNFYARDEYWVKGQNYQYEWQKEFRQAEWIERRETCRLWKENFEQIATFYQKPINKCQAWEAWAEKAQQQEKIKQDWREFNPYQSKLEKLAKVQTKIVEALAKPEKRYTLPNRGENFQRPNYLKRFLSLY